MNYYRIFSKIYERAAIKMCQSCQPFIEKGAKILDLGCGSAIAGNKFKEFFQAEVIGVDIVDRRILPLPFEIIDGKNLPFPEKSFDTVLISYVLHHSQDPTLLLNEAKRVSKKIIIFEDLPEGFFSKIYCKLHQLSFDKLFGNSSKTSFKTEKNWEKIFQELGLNVIFKKKINNFSVKKELFILQI